MNVTSCQALVELNIVDGLDHIYSDLFNQGRGLDDIACRIEEVYTDFKL